MPLIWCSISSHGFGHAAQIVPVLNELHRRIARLTILLRTNVHARFFKGRLTPAWELSRAEQDIGCVQRGPLHIDQKATWNEHMRFHNKWEERLLDEERAIRSRSPDLVLSNISYLAVEAADRAQIPCVALCSLSWDRVLEPFLDSTHSEEVRILGDMSRSYRRADLMIRPMPGLPLTAFPNIRDVGPIADPLAKDGNLLRQCIGASGEERVVLIGFGGIALETLPFDRLEAMTGYRFIVSGTVPDGSKRVVSDRGIPLPFRALLASSDLVVTKPGYSTVTETVASATPMVYVRRYDFADESSLVEYAHRYGRAVELSAEHLATGRWEHALDAAYNCARPRESAPPPTGASEAADILMNYLR